MAKLVVGKNDLATLHPEIAVEADGWDPSTMTYGSEKRMPWKCDKGHTWESQVSKRTIRKQGCPYCTNRKVWTGFNDLKTLFPEVAKEADGWDPSTVIAVSGKKMPWKCTKGHQWKALLSSRTRQKPTGCPYCSNSKVLRGFNDLKTKFPEIAVEADGWDPSMFSGGSGKKMTWKCKEGHIWQSTIGNRTRGSKCPFCRSQKFNRTKGK